MKVRCMNKAKHLSRLGDNLGFGQIVSEILDLSPCHVHFCFLKTRERI